MCGIAGFVGNKSEETIKNMMNEIIYRGPDAGQFSILDDKVHLGHRRLAIIDLSPNGAQPMASHNGRFEIVFNGEIYNFNVLKKSLNRNWKGHSDTEVLIEAISEYGIAETLQRIAGMFAFAVYDKQEKKLFLARDRFGEKPLYYGRQGDHFYFCSELKSLVKHPRFQRKISRQALKSYFRYNYIPAPLSIYEDISKLTPGSFLILDVNNLNFQIKTYWRVEQKPIFTGSYQEALDELEKKLRITMSEQMISDVPVGAFLSGGVDSSTVVALMQSISKQPVRTFSIGFHEKQYDEAVYAKEVARHLGTSHTELYVTPKDALDIIPRLTSVYDEPFSDSSQIPTCLVAQMTKKHVTVALSGDAGDEVFGGYQRYFLAPQLFNKLSFIPMPLRKVSSQTIKAISPGIWDKLPYITGDKAHKLASILDIAGPYQVYDRLITHWSDLENPVVSDVDPIRYKFSDDMTFQENMMLLDSKTYLPDDILVKVDRAGMHVSLESRIPFLDHRIVEFAWSLPMEFKIQNGSGKRILRDVLYKHVPKKLIDRPKKGFGVPIGPWLRTDLKEWAESLLTREMINRSGLLDYNKIKQKWDEHQSGRRNWQYHLWDVIIFQDWYNKNF